LLVASCKLLVVSLIAVVIPLSGFKCELFPIDDIKSNWYHSLVCLTIFLVMICVSRAFVTLRPHRNSLQNVTIELLQRKQKFCRCLKISGRRRVEYDDVKLKQFIALIRNRLSEHNKRLACCTLYEAASYLLLCALVSCFRHQCSDDAKCGVSEFIANHDSHLQERSRVGHHGNEEECYLDSKRSDRSHPR
jgi:hypothetical protein